MLPATLAQDIRQQILHYLEATFNFRRRDEEEALRRFINDPENGLFKGPWVQIRRPFRPAADHGNQFFDLPAPFLPFRHQWLAWQRLTSKGQTPVSTLVTTGTGSGKTECFQVPILDHCYRERLAGRKGIKAIILYPMNALAADQAGRFAEEIFRTPRLCGGTGPGRKAQIRVGLYTGRFDPANPNRVSEGAIREMTIEMDGDQEKAYRAITDQQALRDQPPDILLTNYKMLDFLLMRPKDKAIWRFNQKSRLRYLVLDELHTYDGAQGADVACLIRRLKERLEIAQGELCCVGTSATIAAGDDETTQDPLARLADFAGRLFEEPLQPECVIGEDRLTVEEIMRTPLADFTPVPAPDDCLAQGGETAPDFVRRIAPLFGAPAFPTDDGKTLFPGPLPPGDDTPETRWTLALGHWLKSQPLFVSVLEATRDGPLAWPDLVAHVADAELSLRSVPGFGARSTVLSAFFALIAQARESRSQKPRPLTPTQVQLWIRELRRLGRLVSDQPVFGWLDEKRPDQRILPVAHCTECGESVWVAMVDPDSENPIQARGVQGFQLIADAARIYQGWGFEGSMSRWIVAISPWHPDDDAEPAQGALDIAQWHLSKDSLVLRLGPGPCPLTGSPTFRVKMNRDTHTNAKGQTVGAVKCPHCRSDGSLMFIGAQAATIGSVAIDELFGSVLNHDPKLLAFTDSVQDASHRAGFFSARTFHFTLRTALQRVIDEAGASGLPLTTIGARLLDYWSEPMPGRPGSLRETISTLLPPDLREYEPYLAYRQQAADALPGTPLRVGVEQRLTWEACSEFSLMLTHGRTLEGNASATLGWDDAVLDATVALLRRRLPAIDPTLLADDHKAGGRRLRRWILGILHRQRERGGLYHPYLDSYALARYWGKYPFDRVVAGRELFPPAGRYRPRLMTLAPHRDHDHLLAPSRPGQLPPWQIVWAQRALALTHTPETSILDLLRALVEAGCETGLLREIQRDGSQRLIALSADSARLWSDGVQYACDGQRLYRPLHEAADWEGAPSLAYRGDHGQYQRIGSNDRQLYYQQRYRKGALRRVFAQEHTGLLTTEERESLEDQFNHGGHADDPNVLTATSTLEMGIDIGDLSSTMLCSIPPTTASYLQRIGRAGRSTGTALVLAVINQRPHDLFFFGRPGEMLAGKIEPPGCWLDASAVLVRQYLAFCFDSVVKESVIQALPATGKQLAEDLDSGQGSMSSILAWMVQREAALQDRFMARFSADVREDTRERFLLETRTEVLRERIHKAARDFDSQRQAIVNARKRLADQKKEAESNDDRESLREIEQESRILRGRQTTMDRTAVLEILIEYGLLPNYAFPERGVHFNGVLYSRHPTPGQNHDRELRAYDIVRGAGSALRELAPRNRFYTHSHTFEIQQLALGSTTQPLLEQWAICGECGHIRRLDELNRPDASPACPQCGYAADAHSQLDRSQHKQFLEFARSQAISYMEHYDSLSGDRADEREQRFYRIIPSFDTTLDAPSGAVADESEPFGIEYRSVLALRQVNTGFAEMSGSLPFGVDQQVSDSGFLACIHCGVTGDGDGNRSPIQHRRSCSGRRKTEKMQSEGRPGDAYQWESFYLYRELRSEAIRILLPDVDEDDIATLTACLFLGLRLRFQGNPGHLLVIPQIVPQHQDGLRKHYLVLMDAVPGGTGFLKTLFQDTGADQAGLPGEGVMDLLRRARDALESCSCRLLPCQHGQEDPDGCYRCIRTYHLQYRSDQISRERGIRLLARLIEAGHRRSVIKTLDQLDVKALFGSLLEKRLVDRLREFVETGGNGQTGQWTRTIIKGALGFRFRVGNHPRIWELELQPKLGPWQGVAIPCQPDFLLSADDPEIQPVAIFADGFEPHVRPGQADSRLPDDLRKRRAILDSGRYGVWNITWNDLNPQPQMPVGLLQQHIVTRILPARLAAAQQQGVQHPDIQLATADGFSQMKAYLLSPDRSGWTRLADECLMLPLQLLAGSGAACEEAGLAVMIDQWRNHAGVAMPLMSPEGQWVVSERLAADHDDLLVLASVPDAINGFTDRIQVWLRLIDSAQEREKPGFSERWRRFLALANLFQFCRQFKVFVATEVEEGTVPDLGFEREVVLDKHWRDVQQAVVAALQPVVAQMATAGIALPEVEVYLSDASDCFAELAWRKSGEAQLLQHSITILVGDQAAFASEWQGAGWRVVTLADIEVRGTAWLMAMLPVGD